MRVLKIIVFWLLSGMALILSVMLLLEITGQLVSKEPTPKNVYVALFTINLILVWGSAHLYKRLWPHRGSAVLYTPTARPQEKKSFFQCMRDERARKAEVKRATKDIRRAVVSGVLLDDILTVAGAVSKVAMPAKLDVDTVRAAVMASLDEVVDQALHDGILSEDEESRIVDFMAHYHLTVNDLPLALGERLTQAAVIRDLMEGKVNPRLEVTDMPFNIGKKEIVIWVFRNVHAYEHKTGYRYEGGSRGTSIRIAKGVYWRVGNYKGHKVPVKQRISIGSGPLTITNKYLYFMGEKSLRVAHNKIISIVPTGSSVLVGRDLVRSHTLELDTGDNWALVNMLSNARNWE